MTAGLCALLAMGPIGLAKADGAAVRKEMQREFDKAVAAWKKKDVKGFMSMFSPDFKGVGMDGQPVDYKGIQAQIARTIKSTKSIDSATLSIDKLATKGNQATMDVTMKMTMVVADPRGEMGPKGGTHKLDLVERSHEVWEKTGGQWKQKSMRPLPGGTMKIDGNAMGGPPAPSARPAGPGKK
jgi:hypothetical protein